MKKYGLIGCPLSHSASAEYFSDKFQREDLTACVYSLYELASIEDFVPLLRSESELCGFNVTIPYKRQIIPYLDGISFEAEQIGAVNCVKVTNGKLMGYNTDVAGLRYTFSTFIGETAPDKALILGTGGASQAVQYVLAEMGIEFDLVSRDVSKGNYTYDNLPCDVITSHRLIVNATPTGMYPHTDKAPKLPYAFVSPEHYLLDLVYNPEITQFLDYGAQRGAHICNGRNMFVRQAEESWKIWND